MNFIIFGIGVRLVFFTVLLRLIFDGNMNPSPVTLSRSSS